MLTKRFWSALASGLLLVSCGGSPEGGASSPTDGATPATTESQSALDSGEASSNASPDAATEETEQKASFKVGTIVDITEQEEPKYTFTQPDTYERALNSDMSSLDPLFARLKQKCIDDESSACRTLGRAFYAGWGVPVDRRMGFSFFAKGCDNVDYESCRLLGLAYLGAYGTPRSVHTGEWRLEDSCHTGSSLSCSYIVEMYGKEDEAPEHPLLGEEMYKLTKQPYDKDMVDHFKEMLDWTYNFMESNSATDCYNKEVHGCYELGKFYSERAEDPERAIEPLEKSCDKMDYAPGCALLANRFTPDPEKKLALLNKSCEGGHLEACVPACEARPDEKSVKTCLVDLCEKSRWSDVCQRLALEAGAANEEEALKYADKACEFGGAPGCQLAAEVSRKLGQNDQAAKYEARLGDVESPVYFNQ